MALRHIDCELQRPREITNARVLIAAHSRAILCSLLWLCAAQPGAQASTLSLGAQPPDNWESFLDRAARAPAVVRGQVESLDHELLAAGMPSTRVVLLVGRSFSGEMAAGEHIEVLVPGGFLPGAPAAPDAETPPSIYGWVYDAPRFAEGDEVLLALEPWRGAWTPIELRRGTVRIDRSEISGSSSGTAYLDPESTLRGEAESTLVVAQDLETLEREIATRLGDDQRGLSSSDVQSISQSFELILSPDALPPFGCGDGGGNAIRWFEFERARAIEVFSQEGGQPNVPDTIAAVTAALGAWSGDASSTVRLEYAGTTTATGAIAGLDGLNSIAYEDPGDFFPGSYPAGAPLALTVAFFDCSRLLRFADGDALAHPIVEFGIVTQNGVGSFFFGNIADPQTTLAEILAHEVGHALGFAHPCDTVQDPCVGVENDALMRAVLHQDGRGARLGADERAGLAFLYRANTSPPPTPTLLAAEAISTSSVELRFAHPGGDVLSFDVERRQLGGSYLPIASASGTADRFTVTGLASGSPRLFRIRARSLEGLSEAAQSLAATPLLTPADCVGDALTACLNGERFQVQSFWTTGDESGRGTADSLTEDTGRFWFFEPSNVELVVKAVNACLGFDHYWVFAAALTDVETLVVVADTTTGDTRTYYNPPATPFLPVQDAAAFANCP